MPDSEHNGLAETTIASERVYDGRVVGLRVDEVRLPDGTSTKREVVEHRGAVAIVGLLPGPQVVLVRQWRHPVGKALLEIPAGKLEAGEHPLECAHRELMEEAGYRAGTLEPLATFYSSPGFTDELLHAFLATDLQLAGEAADPDEFIQLVPMDWGEAVSMCEDGRIMDAKTILSILAADRRINGASEGPVIDASV